MVAPLLPKSEHMKSGVRRRAASSAPSALAIPTESAPIHSHGRWTSSPTFKWMVSFQRAVALPVDVFVIPICRSHGGRQESDSTSKTKPTCVFDAICGSG